jgi:cellulose synthase/poly-beta-1,6-N-acetylglucosamine synthase-like glycosyltransferase
MLLYHVLLAFSGYLYADKVSKHNLSFKLSHEASFTSVLVPAHNEEKVIVRTVQALCTLRFDPNRYEVIVVNDSSMDRTGELLKELEKRFSMLRVVHVSPPFGGKGKSRALNIGLREAKGDFIAVYDADNVPEKNALQRLVSTLAVDPSLGAVVGKFRVYNAKKNLLTRFINIETISFQWMIQGGRWNLMGISTIPGTNFVIRRSILNELGGWDENALAEDTELSIRTYTLGYKIQFMPLATTWEQEPETWRVWFKQRTRWVQGNIYVITKFSKHLIRPKSRISIDIFYFFLTYFLFLIGVFLSDLLFVLSWLQVVQLTLSGPLLLIWLLAYALFIVEIIVTLEIEGTELNVLNIIITMFMYFTYSQLWLIIVLRGAMAQIRDKLAGEEIVWHKTERF